MADKRKRTKKVERQITKVEKKNGWIDFLRLDESYTSLILGIIVVIIASILLVSFVKSRHAASLQQGASSISIAPTSYLHNVPLTISPTLTNATATLEVTPPTRPTAAPIVIKTPTAKPTIPLTQDGKGGETYTVKPGDDLWHIAEKIYGSGYNWVDIARANHLVNPGNIYSGNVLLIPTGVPKIILQSTDQTSINSTHIAPSITTSTYVVQKGDSLWTIAQRSYNGNGYRWVDIAKANHLTNPGHIYSGNVLQIPRP